MRHELKERLEGHLAEARRRKQEIVERTAEWVGDKNISSDLVQNGRKLFSLTQKKVAEMKARILERTV